MIVPLFAKAGKRPGQSVRAVYEAVGEKISLSRNSASPLDNDSRRVADWYRARQMSENSGFDGSERAPKRKRASKGDRIGFRTLQSIANQATMVFNSITSEWAKGPADKQSTAS
jgi:hypothetical protein